MANILLFDDSDVTGPAMQGILAEESHAGFVAKQADEAWRRLREGVIFDLIFLELNLPGDGGITFLRRLREDWFWKFMPVVVYTSERDSRMVRKAFGLKVQNYLIKPYREASIIAEVNKALQNPWRSRHFDDPEPFCALMELTPDALKVRRSEVLARFESAAKLFPEWSDRQSYDEVLAGIGELVACAEGAGVWAGVDYLRDLQIQAVRGNWAAFQQSAEYLTYASRLIECQLNPEYIPECLAASRNQLAFERQCVFKF